MYIENYVAYSDEQRINITFVQERYAYLLAVKKDGLPSFFCLFLK